jgi:cell division protein FtsB
MKRVNFSWKYAVLILGVVVIAFLVMNFNSRIANLRRLSVQREAVAARLQGLESTQAMLQTQIARATSEAAVIEWAYQEGNLVRPGDNPVVPVPPEGSTPVPTPTPAVPRPQLQTWQMWLWLFTDSGANVKVPFLDSPTP